jgi:hypothetical protein
MRIVVFKNGKIISEMKSQKQVAEYLGWTIGKVSSVLRSEINEGGIFLDTVSNRERAGEEVCAYTCTSVNRFKSMNECARIYGISRTRLKTLINSGGTAEDGITTFDIPCY